LELFHRIPVANKHFVALHRVQGENSTTRAMERVFEGRYWQMDFDHKRFSKVIEIIITQLVNLAKTVLKRCNYCNKQRSG
jgi:hypothetical protein